MFFGKRRKPKPSDRAPTEFGGDDFGFDETDEPSRPRTEHPRPRKESAAEEPADFDAGFDVSRSAGRSLEDATFVGSSAATPAPSPQAPPPLAAGGPDEDRADATVVIGRPVDPRLALVAWFVVATGPGRGRDHRLGERATRIGTAPECEIRLAGDAYVSTRHAEIVQEGEEVVLRDLGSTNGTYRNDERVREVALSDGDRVRVGLSEFVFKSVRL